MAIFIVLSHSIRTPVGRGADLGFTYSATRMAPAVLKMVQTTIAMVKPRQKM